MMATTRSEIRSWTDEMLPFVAMMMATCVDIGAMTLVKAAMNVGMEGIIYVVYQNALATLILFPFFMVHIFRNVGRPALTFYILLRFFILALLGSCLFYVFMYAGVYYTSPTMASAISNLSPAITFLIAIIFRMEKIDIRSSRSLAKLLGTLIAISGAMVFTLYQGPVIFPMSSSPDSAKQLLLSQPPNLLFGGLLMFISVIIASIWRVIQTATAREFPDQLANVFFFCLFGTLQCVALSPFLVQNPNAWFLPTRIEIIAVSFGGVFGIAFRTNALTWCLEKKGPVYAAMFSPLSILVAVIMGVAFLGDLLHLGSAIGGIIVAVGFYTVMWGQAKEKNNLRVVMEVDVNVSDETSPLLSSENESRC